jgi:hypothetical protein
MRPRKVYGGDAMPASHGCTIFANARDPDLAVTHHRALPIVKEAIWILPQYRTPNGIWQNVGERFDELSTRSDSEKRFR